VPARQRPPEGWKQSQTLEHVWGAFAQPRSPSSEMATVVFYIIADGAFGSGNILKDDGLTATIFELLTNSR